MNYLKISISTPWIIYSFYLVSFLGTFICLTKLIYSSTNKIIANIGPIGGLSGNYENVGTIFTLFIMLFIGFVGFTKAYINKNDKNYFLQSHYQFQIFTFWIGLFYLITVMVLSNILLYIILASSSNIHRMLDDIIGLGMLLLITIWGIIRCIKGFKYLKDQRPIPNPASWVFGN